MHNLNFQITLHSTEELSTDILDKKFRFEIVTSLENHIDLIFSIIEVDDEVLLHNEDINVRRCRYSHEVLEEPLHTYQVNIRLNKLLKNVSYI